MKKLIFITSALCLFTSYIFSQCQAGFTMNTSGDPNISFTNTCSGASTPYYYWNFGDGNGSSSPNPSNIYAYNGTYTVCLHYGDTLNSGCNVTACYTITITNAASAPCNSNFTFHKDSSINNPPGTVYFTDLSTYQPVSWSWNFGDGNTSTDQNPVHQYSVNGTYDVCLTMTNISGSTCSFCDSVNSTPCSQLLNVSFANSVNNSVASFTSNCSGSSSGFYSWDFGDGNYSSLKNPTHSYQYNGTYNVCLTYGDSTSGPNSCSNTFCTSVVITNAANYPCNAIFGYNPDSLNGNSIYFYDQSSSNIVAWNWSFPGGSPSSSTGSALSVTYPVGTYTATLTVTNQSGITCSYTNTISVGTNCSNTNAYFTMTADPTPHVWDVTNYSTGNPPINYSWNWGDGSPNSTGATPTHTYAIPGWYNICLSITDANGCGSSFCNYDTLYKYSANSSMVTVIVAVATGVNEISSSDFSIYPNPASDNFTINFSPAISKGEINIIDLLGEEVKQIPFVNNKSSLIDVSDLHSGIYFLQLKTEQGIAVKKIIISR